MKLQVLLAVPFIPMWRNVDALVLGTSTERFAGANPAMGTTFIAETLGAVI